VRQVPRGRVLIWAGLAGVVALSTVLVVLVVWISGGGTGFRRGDEPPEIEAEADLAPKVALFGDTVLAHVDVVLDSTLVDPDSVRIAADFLPWEVVGTPKRRQVSAGDWAYLRTTYTLRCLSSVCVPSGRSTTYEFAPGRVAFERVARAAPDEDSLRVPWPSFRVFSRFAAADLHSNPRSSAPWQADVVSLPAVSFRFGPGRLVAVFLLAAFAAALGAMALAYAAWPRRELAPPPPPPPPPPEPALSTLEQALVLLEKSVRHDGAEEQRRALELVAEELETAEWGDRTLANAARRLAWSEDAPPVEATSDLAAHVRSALELSFEGHENGDGRAT
jgi:hypothetical protein